MSSAFMGELLGTMTLILLGNGVVACVLLKGSFGEGAGWLAITTGWGLAVMAGVVVALTVGSNAHINPAVTIGVSLATGDLC
jgi:glycerol uptake facilitator protein